MIDGRNREDREVSRMTDYRFLVQVDEWWSHLLRQRAPRKKQVQFWMQ